LFTAGETVSAEPAFRAVLQKENRIWVQREQRAWLMRCAYRRDDRSTAAAEFLEILKTDPQTTHWAMAPLIWHPVALSLGQQAQAKSWLVSSAVETQLLGASWLLQDPMYGKPAQRVLDELARNTNPVISQLARTQQWRIGSSGSDLNELMLDGWKRDLERLPEHLRAGPTMLIARGFAQLRDDRQAAAEYLWLPLVYADHEPLAARACLEAAEAFRRSGLTHEAENQYREVLARYPWSPMASEARSRLNAATPDASETEFNR
ncbi:MAG: hypothetical protein KDA58_09260, partial [Planctomycetaceae bacterium]|nr:hypothetical protein [Planctomycetaceae bacterium]